MHGAGFGGRNESSQEGVPGIPRNRAHVAKRGAEGCISMCGKVMRRSPLLLRGFDAAPSPRP